MIYREIELDEITNILNFIMGYRWDSKFILDTNSKEIEIVLANHAFIRYPRYHKQPQNLYIPCTIFHKPVKIRWNWYKKTP